MKVQLLAENSVTMAKEESQGQIFPLKKTLEQELV